MQQYEIISVEVRRELLDQALSHYATQGWQLVSTEIVESHFNEAFCNTITGVYMLFFQRPVNNRPDENY